MEEPSYLPRPLQQQALEQSLWQQPPLVRRNPSQQQQLSAHWIAVSMDSADSSVNVTLISKSNSARAQGPPVYVGNLINNNARWKQMMEWLPGFVKALDSSLYRVHCRNNDDAIQGVIDCHTQVANAALQYWGDGAGTYIDLEDNCYPSQRGAFTDVLVASHTLLDNPDWMYIHLSRMPAPVGLVNPETSFNTSFANFSGSPVYIKMYGTCELAQAMLCHTEYARKITDPSFEWTAPYDDQFAYASTHVVYPAIIQRHTESDTATEATDLFAAGSVLSWLRDVFFTPWVYTVMDVINAHAAWFSLFILPVTVVACVTNDWLISLFALIIAFIIVWALGVR